MKKINLFMAAGIAGSLLLFQSCSKKIDEAYLNPNAQTVQPIEELLPNVIQNMVISNTAQGTLYGPQNDGLYVGRYIQNWGTNTANNQYDQMGGATGGSDILGSIWAMHYYGMGQNVTRIIEWGTEQKKWDYVGVAHAIRAWSWLQLTDMYGEAILKDAFNTSILVFRYDTQQEIYEEAKRQAHLAIDFLSRSGDGVSADNLAKGAQWTSYKGDKEKWKRFAYSVLARVFNRYTNKGSLYKADSVIHYANQGITSNADNLYVLFEGGATVKMSYYGPTRGNIGTLRQTKFIADLMSGVNTRFNTAAVDPRAWYKLRENTNGTFKGITLPSGTAGLLAADIPPNFWGSTGTTGTPANSRYIWQDAMPWPIITASEMAFLKAEANYRKNLKGDARTAYREGILLDFDMLTSVAQYGNGVPAANRIDATVRDNYLANAIVVPAANALTLSHIMLQKYIALYGYGFIETWADMRRFHYLDTEGTTGEQVYADFAPPTLANLYQDNKQKYVYRARPRYNSEYLYNIDGLNQIGAMVGNAQVLDYHTKEMWYSMY
ncbi:MAG TPA: SusD/RagB family nutrient-binding outer membrane lipoprotein [Flavisolibacter sp.]|nr:SusD/RagB family nutrient-binding outer membrane lipoprotein [Flavisolibacter sp.]